MLSFPIAVLAFFNSLRYIKYIINSCHYASFPGRIAHASACVWCFHDTLHCVLNVHSRSVDLNMAISVLTQLAIPRIHGRVRAGDKASLNTIQRGA